MKRIIISMLLTLVLGPGAGHIYLRRFVQGILLIVGTIAVFVHMSWQIVRSATDLAAVNANPSQFFQDFSSAHPTTIFYYDAIFAALWAYALVDVYFKAGGKIPFGGRQSDTAA